MNILHISTPVSWRGGEQQLAYLALALKDEGHEQYFICAENGAVATFSIENDFALFGINAGALQMLSNASLVKRVCRHYAIDVIHTHDSKSHTIAYISAVRGNKTPIAVSRRVDFPVGKSLLSRKKYNHPSVKAIICVSRAIMEITGRSIVNKSVLKVVYDGIETRIDAPAEKPDLRKMFGLPADSVVIGNVAALAPHKDYFTWLETVAILKKRNPKMRFLIIGDGPQKAEIMAYLKKKELQDVVTATGFREDAKALLWELDVFLNTSETEGLGSSLLDAFVRRVPVVATHAGGIPEIVIDQSTGLLAPVKQPAAIAAQVEQLLLDTKLREKLVHNAFVFAQGFDTKIMAEKTLEIYKELK